LMLGIAFDGDSYRIRVVYEKGEVIGAYQLMAFFLPEIID
jgi:Phosphomannomutase